MQRLPGVLVATTNYVLLLIAPVGLHMEYGKKLFSWGDWRVFAGAALLSALIVSIMRARKKSSIIFFGLGFFLITLLPQTNLLYPINAYMAEHWLYVPSMGILLIAAGAFCRLYRREHGRGTAIALIMLLIFSHIVLTLYQNSYWRNPISLYEATLRYAPRSSRIMVYLGDELSKQKDFEGATALYQKAIAIEPSANAYYNLGNTFRLQGRNSDAIAAYRHATEHDSRFVRAYYNLGGMFLLEKDYAQAAAAYRKALELDPSNMQAKKYVDELSVTRAH
jgi:tetratricopeptide (TPR) repeat protein